MPQSEPGVITRSRLVKDLREVGVLPGKVLMVHGSVKAMGWVVGGPDTVIEALLDVLTPEGTLMMLVGWEDGTYEMGEWPEEKQRAYLEECPPFDPVRSRAYRKWSILTEYLRTWPEACRSNHPDSSFAAVGKLAEWITKDHPLQYGYGPGSPLAKLCEAKGQVLVLGSPVCDVTLLHHAEHMARVASKPVVRYKAPMLVDGRREWVEIEEYDTNRLIGDWEGESYFDIIPREFLAAGRGRSGKVGSAQSHLFDAHDLNQFAVGWLEDNMGGRAE